MADSPSLGSFTLSDFLEQVEVAIIVLDRSRKIASWNRQAENLFGYSADEVIGRAPEGLMIPEATSRQILAQMAVGGDPEFLVQTKTGNSRIVSSRNTVIRDEEGGDLGIVSVMMDITERHLIEQQLRLQNAVAQAIAAGSNLRSVSWRLMEALAQVFNWQVGIFWRADEEGTLHYAESFVSPRISDRSIIEQSKILSLAEGQGLPGRVVKEREAVSIEVTEGDTSLLRGETLTASGLISAFAFPIFSDEKVIAVVEFMSDTHQQLGEGTRAVVQSLAGQVGQFMETLVAEDALRSSEERKSSILNAAMDAIITMREDGKILEWNPAAEEVFGYTREEAVGQEMTDLIIPAYLREHHSKGFKRYLDTREPRILNTRVEMQAMRKDKSEFPAELTVTVVELEEGALFTAFIRDITEQRAVKEELASRLQMERFLKEQAERAQEGLSFLAEASRVLSATLDYEQTIKAVARLCVPRLADWCVIDMVNHEGEIERIAVTHADPEKEAWASEYQKQSAPTRDRHSASATVIKSGEAQLYPEITIEMLEGALSESPELLATIQALGLRSSICVPVRGRDHTLGAITLIYAESERNYEERDLSLAEDLGRRIGLALENASFFQAQREVASRLQATLLPSVLPRIPCVDVAAHYRPGSQDAEVGGDFYDLFQSPDDSWFAVIGDVCGKGIDAATLTGLARTTVRTAALLEKSPARILEILNQAILAASSDSKFATVAVARFEKVDSGLTFCFASGGHPAPLVLRSSGSVDSVDQGGMAVGMFPDMQYEEKNYELNKGDMIVFYTDGVTESRRDGELFGTKRLEELLASCADGDAVEAAAFIDHSAVGFAVDGMPHDDIAILVIQPHTEADKPSAATLVSLAGGNDPFSNLPSRINVQMEANLKSIATARRVLAQLEGLVPEDKIETLRLLISEVVSNAIKHTGASDKESVELSLEVQRGKLRVEVTDPGVGFQASDRELHEDQESGWGLWFVQEMTDRWGTSREEGSTVWFEIDIA
jgi:PAS domain S-box-containing protein